jgi:carboxymethylenebutenolidase
MQHSPSLFREINMERAKASDFDQRILDLYDDFAHGRISRRDFMQRAGAFAAVGMTAEAILDQLTPNYAWAQQVSKDDPRISTETIEYDSPQGGGKIRSLLAKPTAREGKLPAVLVVHENRGLNPYIEDVARRLAASGFLALAPDALSPLGGYPGNDDEGRAMQAKRDPEQMVQDFIAAAKFLKEQPHTNGKVGVVGFCYGGGIANDLAVRIPETISAAVPFYGRQPSREEVSKIKAPLLIHYAELDQRINAGWPAYEEALNEANVQYTAYTYPGVNHGFHNDTTPRYDEAAAKLAWDRTIAFFKKHLN